MEKNLYNEFTKSTKYRDVYAESGCDYVLPDYKQDVKKVLYTSATVIPSGKFFDSGELACSGIVTYNIVYLDSENRTEGIDFTSDYEFSLKTKDEGYIDSSVDTRVANLSVRLTGPRKFSVKAALSSVASIVESASVSTEGDAFEEECSAELDTKELLVRRTRFFSAEEKELAERIAELDGVSADDIRVINSSADVDIESVNVSEGTVVVIGNVISDTVLQNGVTPPYLTRKRIPFEQTVSAEGVGEGDFATATGVVTSVKTEINPEEFGCNVTTDVIMEITLCVEDNVNIELARDGYVIKCGVDNIYDDFRYTELKNVKNDRCDIEVRERRSELSLDSAREIVFVSAQPKVEGVEYVDEGIRVDAEIRFSGVACDVCDDDTTSYIGLKHSAKVSHIVKCDLQNPDNLSCDVRLRACSAEAQIDKEDVVFSCELCIDASVCEDGCEKYLASCNRRVDEKYESCSSRITVYFPDKNDTLFGIAKKFHTTVRDIAVNNSLAESVAKSSSDSSALIGVKKLIIK